MNKKKEKSMKQQIEEMNLAISKQIMEGAKSNGFKIIHYNKKTGETIGFKTYGVFVKEKPNAKKVEMYTLKVLE